MSLYLLRALTHDYTAPFVIQHGSVCLPDHLEDVIYGIVHISDRKHKYHQQSTYLVHTFKTPQNINS